MQFLRTLAPWLLLVCLAWQVSVSTCARDRGQRRKGEGGRGAAEQQSPPGRAQKAAATSGQFTTKEKFRCRWAAQEDSDMMVKLGVTCQSPDAARHADGVTDFTCEYIAKPATCPGYGSNPAGFWKQVARALKKLQNKLCTDDRALVRAGMCKRAPRDAHFKLDRESSVASALQPEGRMRQQETSTPRTPTTSAAAAATATATTAAATTTTTAAATTTTQTPVRATTEKSCTESVDQKKLAEEYCSGSWTSFCAFFFAVIQSGDC